MAFDFTGKYKLTHSEKFDEYMKAIGVGMVTRKLAATAKPTCEIKSMGDNWYTITTSSTFKTTEISFKIGENFQETTGDGRKCVSTITMESENKMKHVQVCQGHTYVIWREFTPTEMKMTLEAPGVTCIRIYKKT